MRVLFLTILYVLSCTPPTQKAPSSSKGASKTSTAKSLTNEVGAVETRTTDEEETEAPPPPSKKLVDGSKLTVSNITIGKLAVGSSKSEVVNFSASGPTQYVLWKLCPEEPSPQGSSCVPSENQSCGLGGACVQNVTPYNKIIFPKLMAGKVTFSIKACVDPESATDPNNACGPFTDMEYDSQRADTRVSTLFAKRQSLIDQLTTKGEEIRKIYMNYEGDLKQCMEYDKKNALFYQSKIAAVHGLINGVFWKMFTWGPKALIEEMNKSSVGQSILGAVKTAAGTVKDAVKSVTNKFCAIGETTGIDTTCMETLKDNATTMTQTEQEQYCQNAEATKGPVGKFCGIVGTILHAMAGMVSGMNPAESIGVLSDAIHNVIDPGASVSITCLAEQKMAKTLQAANESAAAMTHQLVETSNELRSLGEL